MAIRIGRTCESCGFDNAEVGQDCPLCGLSATVAPSPEAPTLAMGEATSTLEFDPASLVPGQGKRAAVPAVRFTGAARELEFCIAPDSALAHVSSP